MSYSDGDVMHILWNYDQLQNIVRSESEEGFDERSKLDKVEKIIKTEIPDLMKKVAPPNIYDLMEDFHAEYEKFKDFIIYKALIGKKVVGLGGGFSSGKSSFLNSMMNQGKVLPEDIDASTAVPTYIVRGENDGVKAVNIFDASFNMDTAVIRQIAHGFGAVGEGEQKTAEVPLGHILKNMFFETPSVDYDNLAFLDTPGYSKPESEHYSVKTDERIAREQLNTVDYILWFSPVDDAGSLSDSDIKFMESLDLAIPITVICSKSNRRTQTERDNIKKKMQEQISLHKLNIENIYCFDKEDSSGLDSEKIHQLFDRLNKEPYEERVFAKHFKRLFWNCREYYKKKKEELDGEIGNLNNALMQLEDGSDIDTYINRVKSNSEKERQDMETAGEETFRLQTDFFTEIKIIADQVGISMPEPGDIDVLEDRITNPLTILRQYNQKHKKEVPKNLKEQLSDIFRDVNPVFECEPGGSRYKEVVADILSQIEFPAADQVQFGRDVNYNEMMQAALSDNKISFGTDPDYNAAMKEKLSGTINVNNKLK